MEPQTPSGGDGALAQAQARVRDISARAFEAFIKHTGSPRKAADHLAEMGYFGRGGAKYRDTTVHEWRTGRFAPSALVFIAAMLDIELSFDELAYGSGLRAQVARLEYDLEMLAGVVTRHIAGQEPEAAGRRDEEPG